MCRLQSYESSISSRKKDYFTTKIIMYNYVYFSLFLLLSNCAYSQTIGDTISVIKEALFWTKFSYYLYPQDIFETKEFIPNVQNYMNKPQRWVIYINTHDIKYKFDYTKGFDPKPIFNNSWLEFVFLDADEHCSSLQKAIIQQGILYTHFYCYRLNSLKFEEDRAKIQFKLIDYYIKSDDIIPFGDDVSNIINLKNENGHWVYIPNYE